MIYQRSSPDPHCDGLSPSVVRGISKASPKPIVPDIPLPNVEGLNYDEILKAVERHTLEIDEKT